MPYLLAIIPGPAMRTQFSTPKRLVPRKALPILRLLLPEGFARDARSDRAGVARVVDQDIDFAESRARFFKHRGDRRKVGHVALRGERLDAQLLHFGGNRLGALEAEIVDDHAAGVVLREAKRDRAPDALSSAGHQGRRVP